MLDHAVMWSYRSIWKRPVTVSMEPEGRRQEHWDIELAAVIAERTAYDLVMDKARLGAAPAAWTIADRSGHA